MFLSVKPRPAPFPLALITFLLALVPLGCLLQSRGTGDPDCDCLDADDDHEAAPDGDADSDADSDADEDFDDGGETEDADVDVEADSAPDSEVDEASCEDGERNGAETGTDCGGPDCSRCEAGQGCSGPDDCTSGVCADELCAEPTCEDDVANGDETAQDCGGPSCPPCAPGLRCLGPRDCESVVCADEVCAEPSCADEVRNGDETALNCGGTVCPPCGLNSHCHLDRDCDLGVCDVVMEACRRPSSCAELLAAHPETAGIDTVYQLDLDAEGAEPAVDVYCDMTTDGGGWTLCLNSVAGSANGNLNDVDANTGTVGWDSGHTRKCNVLIGSNAQLRHLIVGTGPDRVFNQYYSGTYEALPLAGMWTPIPPESARGNEVDNWPSCGITYHFGQSFQRDTLSPCFGQWGVYWYYTMCWTVIPSQTNPVFCTTGPDTLYNVFPERGCGQRYSIFAR